MSTQVRLSAATAALVLGMAVLLAACGSETAPTTANITFNSDPASEVWIAGESKGTTPMDIVLAAGTHEVMFKAAGFADAADKIIIEGGKPLTVNAELCASAADEVTLVQLAKALGLEHVPYEEGKVHRGARSRSVTLLWPQREIRKEGLTSYRIDVSEEYEGDGFIEFRKGRKVLHREAFEPESFATVRSMPESVKEAVKTSSSVTWGVYFESKRKKAITAKFKIVKKSKVDRQLKKLNKRSFFRRQPPLIQDLMRVDVLRNNRLYSEALVGALGILQAFPESLQPYRGIVEAAQRLGLKDTQLFAEAMQHVAGRGGRGRTPAGLGNVARPGTQSVLPPVFSSPRREEEQPEGGVVPTDGGVTVRPTEEDAPADGATPIVPGQDNPNNARTRALDQMRQELANLEQRGQDAEQNENRLHESSQRLEQANQTARDADAAANLAREERDRMVNDGATEAQLATQDAEIRRLEREADQAGDTAREVEREHEMVSREVGRALEQSGSSVEAAREAEELQRRIEAMEEEQRQATPERENPGGPGQEGDERAQHAQMLEDHRNRVANAERTQEAAAEAVLSASRLLEAAQHELEVATEAVRAAEAADDHDAIEAAREAFRVATDADTEARRARDEAVEALTVAERDAEEATEALAEHEQSAPPADPAGGLPSTDDPRSPSTR